MMNKNLFENENVKLRLIQLDYNYKNKFDTTNIKKLAKAKSDFEKDVRKIYKEETNKELPVDIEIYTSKELLKNKDSVIKNSGYDGTAIYINDDRNERNQLHVISQGSADNGDWTYNFFGLFLGIDDSQYKATKEFTIEAKKKTQGTGNVKTFAMGHSLANNNQVLVQLIDGEFDEVYGINGAQISVDHVLKADYKLTNYLKRKFNIIKINEISKNDLNKAITKYYKDKGVTANITQRISKDDPLYGVSGKADFITFGDVKMTDTNADVKGIRNIMDGIPDEDVRSIQKYLQKYEADYKSGGLNGFVKAATGIDIELVENIIKADGVKAKSGVVFNHYDEIWDMVNHIRKDMPAFLTFFHTVLNNSGSVVDQLAENGYIDETQKKKINKQFSQINDSVSDIESQFQTLLAMMATNNMPGTMYILTKMWGSVQDIRDSLDTLNAETKEALKMIIEGHSIIPMLNALSKVKGISYKGTDIYFTGKSGKGQKIEVNISSAVRMYQAGMRIIEEIEEAITRYQRTFTHEIEESFAEKKLALRTAIHHMEENPSCYAFDLQFRLAAGYGHPFDKLEKISVHESFHTAALPSNDAIIAELKKQTTEKRHFIKDIRTSIEKLFEKDEIISQLFDFQP
ncbi:DUF6792 domain-containing protein [Bacillus atrophaeus]|uniref:DUF6792 domain-containing protein n=1 Tax=Bacillus atrophaeus TaxID=1452 RepID=UPI00077A776A|nr:DUF6792 domain-containing protein [Bacillus atrophaeus]KXZ19585.1 hypothetical protein AXI57_03035 [Bacillus atrophaeus]MED4807751.1 hypothetical protein [Bacillus atrophaeus]